MSNFSCFIRRIVWDIVKFSNFYTLSNIVKPMLYQKEKLLTSYSYFLINYSIPANLIQSIYKFLRDSINPFNNLPIRRTCNPTYNRLTNPFSNRSYTMHHKRRKNNDGTFLSRDPYNFLIQHKL